MALFQSNNPVFNEKVLQKVGTSQTEGAMTIKGTINKMAFLLVLVMAAAIYAWGAPARQQNIMPFLWGGALGGFALAIIITFKKEWAQYLAPAYALAEGLFLGVISVLYSNLYEGIVLQAVGITFATFLAMLILYRTRIIRATEKFKAIVFTATAGIALFYLLALVLSFFNINIPFLHEGSTIGIIFSLVVVVVAALNLIINFDLIETGAAQGAPKYFEWYASFGMLVTLIWLYLEILRLLSKLNRR
ncbi:Bax inhibitor-1/YccA family protein [Chitinophaga ginsengisoli]|uniref:Putative YccA/Bax inhibitor family protein n=1 Tax=Chitinophaga ginsengisoli TaxID=363837 RepID=A0A2P8GPR8_9BACT|nr:Bax inhibitor-1/YccA family protein [Chitinophaga ginsengisoli]PSL35945.1 putative YccA/Bax inhibitor family protein [Chitinophaga ginsengisoli]